MNLVKLKSAPNDLSAILRDLADRVDSGSITGMVIAHTEDDNYHFHYSANKNDCLIMATFLHQNCIDRLRA